MFSVGITLNPATIAAGAALSGPCALGALTLVGISMPAVWTAAPLTFQVSPDGGTTWQELYDGAGNEITVTAAAGQFVIPLADPSYLWRGINMVRRPCARGRQSHHRRQWPIGKSQRRSVL